MYFPFPLFDDVLYYYYTYTTQYGFNLIKINKNETLYSCLLMRGTKKIQPSILLTYLPVNKSIILIDYTKECNSNFNNENLFL